jgi:predicted enzyme related to lactoylglutathione lyase
MNSVQIEQKSYEMPSRDGFSVAHFLTVADIDRSLRFYETVFGGQALSRGDSEGAPGYIQIANTWLLVNVGGGPTPDKPSVTLSVPNPDEISSFMNIRVADIKRAMNYGKVEERSSSPSRSPSTARRAATSAILTVTLSRSDRAPPSSTVNARPGRYSTVRPRKAVNWQAPEARYRKEHQMNLRRPRT